MVIMRVQVALVLCAALIPPGVAKEAALTSIASCVSDARISFGPGDHSAVLDDTDARAVSAAITRLYPVVERDGALPSRVLLWQPRSGEMLYVALLANPDRPTEQCFTATFAASKFDATLLLRSKYFFSGADKP